VEFAILSVKPVMVLYQPTVMLVKEILLYQEVNVNAPMVLSKIATNIFAPTAKISAKLALCRLTNVLTV